MGDCEDGGYMMGMRAVSYREDYQVMRRRRRLSPATDANVYWLSQETDAQVISSRTRPTGALPACWVAVCVLPGHVLAYKVMCQHMTCDQPLHLKGQPYFVWLLAAAAVPYTRIDSHVPQLKA